MISIFIMYSNDRSEALSHTIRCLEDMPEYASSQKTLVVDGRIEGHFRDWEFLQVPRIGGKFCWSRMWDAGVGTSRYPVVFYLDSDRLLHPNFLHDALRVIEDNMFVFTSKHFMMHERMSLDQCKVFLKHFHEHKAIPKEFLNGQLAFEPRFKDPIHWPGKNVMSGSVVFTKRTYFRLGGVDPWYCGHGTFADTDFHQQAASASCRFVDLNLPELHFVHDKRTDDGKPLAKKELDMLSLDNFIHYCIKWRLPIGMAEDLANQIGISRPSRYIASKVKAVAKES